MKKNLLLAVASIFTLNAFAQTTVNIFASGVTGSFTTGTSSNMTRTEGNIVTTGAAPNQRRGYAVFDLATVPASATVTSVVLHYNMAAVTGVGMTTGCTTRGYAGDLSTITAAGTLYTTMGLGTSLWTTDYPTAAGNASLPTNAAAENMVQTNVGTRISMIWSVTNPRNYNITGQSGATTTTGTHAPYLAVTYNCPGITTISANGPATNPCPNTAFSLSGSATGSIAGYSWAGPFGFSAATASPTVTAGLPVSGIYTLTVTDATGCTAKATALVNVNPAPTADIIPTTPTVFCDGNDTQLGAVTPGADYQWYEGTTLIPGATDQTYTTDTTGSYKVLVTDAAGCSALTSVFTPTLLLDTPSVTPGDTVLLCTGDIGTLNVNTNGIISGLTFQWQKNGVNIPLANNSNYTVNTSGIYRVVVSVNATACSSTSEEVDVIVNNFPLPTVSYSGANLSTAAYTHYQWFLNTVAITGATNQTYHPTAAGSYRVRVIDAAGCTAFSPAFVINTTAVGNVSVADIKLYPNPANNILNIESPIAVKAVISTMEGKNIYAVDNARTLNVGQLAPGLYMVTIYDESGNRLTTEKLIKQ